MGFLVFAPRGTSMTERFIDFELSSGLILTMLVFLGTALIVFSAALSTMVQNLTRARAVAEPAPDPLPSDNPALGHVRPFANATNKRPPTLLVTVILGVAGGGLLLYGGWQAMDTILIIQDTNASSRWPSVLGEILTVDTVFEDEGFRAAATYQYVVDGKTYTSDRISFRKDEPIYFSTSLHQEYLTSQGLTANNLIRVYYDPDAPEKAALIRKHDVSIADIVRGILLVAIGAILVGFGITNSIEVWREHRNRATVSRQQVATAP